MAEISRTLAIAAEPQAIWDVLADFGAVASWAHNLDHSCLLSAAADGIDIGTTRRIQKGRDTLVERITEFDPPRALAYAVEGFPRVVRHVHNRWVLTPFRRATLVTLTSTVETGGRALQRIAGGAIARLGARHLDALLDGLAHRTEVRRV